MKTSSVSQSKQSTDELAKQFQTRVREMSDGRMELAMKFEWPRPTPTNPDYKITTTGTVRWMKSGKMIRVEYDREIPDPAPQSTDLWREQWTTGFDGEMLYSWDRVSKTVAFGEMRPDSMLYSPQFLFWGQLPQSFEQSAPGSVPQVNLPRITYTLIPACELTLRAVDVETGKGLAGAEFYQENAGGEEWGHPVYSSNIGAKFDSIQRISSENNLTDNDGNFRRLVGKLSEDTMFGVEQPPPGYLPEVKFLEVPVVTKYGQARAEHVFKFRRIRWDVKVEPEKKKIMLGEPMWLTFTVTRADS